MSSAGFPSKQGATAFAAAAAFAVMVWLVACNWMPAIGGMTEQPNRIDLAIKCGSIAGLFTLLAMIEAVSHERLRSRAFDPLLGVESRRLLINTRVLQNTLEQFALFFPSLLILALYCEGESGARFIVAATIVWTLARLVFWIGYHLGPQHRAAGLIGYAQTMILLIYGAARFGYEIGGWLGATTPIFAFVIIEIVLVFSTRPHNTSDVSGG